MGNLGGALTAAILVVLCSCCVDVARGQITDPNDVNALKAIKHNLIDPTNKLKNWGSGDPCTSRWRGIICGKIPSDSYLHVTEIQLFKMNLSGTLAPEVGLLSQLKTLDFMWNNLTGNIPKEVGNITTLKLITLNGNQLSGSLPEEIGKLVNLDRLQIDQNNISGPIPKSFANLTSVKHLHMNNNSLSGQIPSELSRLPLLLHLLVDNNNLSGPLPPKLAETPTLKILQADNNNFSGSSIPVEYSKIQTLLKLSLRNCSLQGTVPDMSGIPEFGYLDLSWNQLNGSIPTNRLASNITTIDLSHNFLNGTIPSTFSGLPNLQFLNFQNNSLDTIPATFDPPEAVTVLLYGNPVCTTSNAARAANLCRPTSVNEAPSGKGPQPSIVCVPCPTDKNYEYNPSSPIPCFCAVPLGVGFRLKSPGISDFVPYKEAFDLDLTSLLDLLVYQLYVERYIWETGPRLNMHLKLFPSNTSLFNMSEVVRLRQLLAGWQITLSDVFGPYELLNFTLGSYEDEFPETASSGLKKGALAGILAGAIVAAIALSVAATIFIMKKRTKRRTISRRSLGGSGCGERQGYLKSFNNIYPCVLSRFSIKVDGMKCFTFDEMAAATSDFTAQIGQGGYGKVYKGNLADGTAVAIKRAHEDSLQGSKEFCTEIELLSRLHHRNLVSLIGYCDEEDEQYLPLKENLVLQMLVYEFMPNGTLRDHLSAKSERPLSFSRRLHIALGASKGILYLHTEANPPIFHRDVKASNILLDSKFVAKVADFGLSRLAPVPDIEGTLPAHISTVVKGTPVNTAYQSDDISKIIDSRMLSYPPECATRFLALAIKCCRDDTEARPFMADIVRELETIRGMLPEGEDSVSQSMELGSGALMKSMSSSTTTGALFVSSQTSGGAHTNSGIPSGTVAPR
ncbi:hypothetical protein EJB05_18564 [Eragrostis curvula]|uniref:non-specific serine/threonine protein kinase n=1 Tax=Eragrostis curvula TaxID=38414 RepID=A0A5J9VMF0_9POAL|nr:hypothetical protein EJB05_18564 [Eragrostis curvula]